MFEINILTETLNTFFIFMVKFIKCFCENNETVNKKVRF